MMTTKNARATHSVSSPRTRPMGWGILPPLLLLGLMVGSAGCQRAPSVSSRAERAETPAVAPLHAMLDQAGDASEAGATAGGATGNDHRLSEEVAADAGDDGETEAQMWEIIEETFARKGELKDGVYRLVTPRDDLFVTMHGMDVPTGAFLESDFRFWPCPCGKLLVNGQFVLADYEVNDVVDELQEGRLEVVAIAPLLLHEHPRLLMVRFQGEGRTRPFAEALKSALSYTGEARNAPQPVDLSPRMPEQ